HHRVWGTYSRHRPDLDQVTLLSLPLQPGVPLREVVHAIKPEIVVYCAGIADERQCHANPTQAQTVNSDGAVALAQELGALGGHLIFLSTSKVFAGDRGQYREEDATDGQSLYGRM